MFVGSGERTMIGLTFWSLASMLKGIGNKDLLINFFFVSAAGDVHRNDMQWICLTSFICPAFVNCFVCIAETLSTWKWKFCLARDE